MKTITFMFNSRSCGLGFFLLCLAFPFSLYAQFEEIDIYQTQIDPVSGIRVLSKDSSYSIHMRFRMQNRFEAEADGHNEPLSIDRHVFFNPTVATAFRRFCDESSVTLCIST